MGGDKKGVTVSSPLVPLSAVYVLITWRGSRFAALLITIVSSSPDLCLQHGKDKSSLRFCFSSIYPCPSCSPSKHKDLLQEPQLRFPPPALVEQIYIPHQQQLWLSLQICWHLGLRWVEHIEINFWLSLMVMSHYSSCIIWPYSSFRWEIFFPLCIFSFFPHLEINEAIRWNEFFLRKKACL